MPVSLISISFKLFIVLFHCIAAAMRVLQVLDHVGIYLVIVGTMTPFMLVGLHHHTSARVLICAEWIAAFLGSIFAGKCSHSVPIAGLEF